MKRGVNGTSPNIHALIGGAHHRRAVRNAERFLKFRQVRERPVHPKLRRRMRIGGQAHFLVFITNFLSPDRGEGQEEALLWREAVDLFRAFLRMYAESLWQRSLGEVHSAS